MFRLRTMAVDEPLDLNGVEWIWTEFVWGFRRVGDGDSVFKYIFC